MLPLLVPLLATALTAGPVQFSGSASVYGECGWVGPKGETLVEPRPELRFRLNPTVSIYGLPLSFHALVSDQQSKMRQMLNQFRLSVNPAALLKQVPGVPGIPSPLSFLSFVKGLELGTCHPNWSSYTLSGATVTGAAVEVNPWYVYAAAAAGRTQRAIGDTTAPANRQLQTDTLDPVYSRMLYSGKLGFGKKERTHFYLTGVYVADDSTSLRYNGHLDTVRVRNRLDTAWVESVTPKENFVLGAEFVADADDGLARLEAEITVCELTRDTRTDVLASPRLPDCMQEDTIPPDDTVPGCIMRTFKPRYTSSFDFAWKVRQSVNWYGTKMYAKAEMVGPGYKSLGAPGLRSDNMAVSGGIERSLFDNAVSISATYRVESDNLLAVEDTVAHRILRLKPRTTKFTHFAADIGIAFPNLPYLQIGYYPYAERSDSMLGTGGIGSTMTSSGTVISASAGHSFQTGKVSHSPGVSFSYNDVRGDDPAGNNNSWDAGLNYGLGFENPLSLSGSCGYSQSEAAVTGDTVDTRLYFDISPSYTLFNSWRNSLSLGGTFLCGTRIDARLTSSFPIWKICDASVSVIDAVYNGDDGKYNDLRLTTELRKSW